MTIIFRRQSFHTSGFACLILFTANSILYITANQAILMCFRFLDVLLSKFPGCQWYPFVSVNVFPWSLTKIIADSIFTATWTSFKSVLIDFFGIWKSMVPSDFRKHLDPYTFCTFANVENVTWIKTHWNLSFTKPLVENPLAALTALSLLGWGLNIVFAKDHAQTPLCMCAHSAQQSVYSLRDSTLVCIVAVQHSSRHCGQSTAAHKNPAIEEDNRLSWRVLC